jgi:NAD(P)-dependent dehydrogenase (short-subunit alcohol dehydrogenase family)
MSAGLLRAGLLQGSSVLVAGASDVSTAEHAGADGAAFAAAVLELCADLGAACAGCGLALATDADGDEQQIEAAVAAALPESAPDVLVLDCAWLFARAGLGGALQATWGATRAVAQRSFIEGGAGGRIVLIAPAPAAGEHARAAAAGLENLARTLSIEWARYAITAVAIAPGDDTPPGEVAVLAAYLASPAGEYFSGCLLDMRGVALARDGVAPPRAADGGR